MDKINISDEFSINCIHWAKVPRFSEGHWGMSSPTGHSPGPRGEPWDLFIIPWLCRFTTFYYWFPMSPNSENVGHWEDCFSMSPTFCKKTWDIGSTVFQCPPLFAPMSHVLWNYPGKCPVLLLRVKPAKPGYNAIWIHVSSNLFVFGDKFRAKFDCISPTQSKLPKKKPNWT